MIKARHQLKLSLSYFSFGKFPMSQSCNLNQLFKSELSKRHKSVSRQVVAIIFWSFPANIFSAINLANLA